MDYDCVMDSVNRTCPIWDRMIKNLGKRIDDVELQEKGINAGVCASNSQIIKEELDDLGIKSKVKCIDLGAGDKVWHETLYEFLEQGKEPLGKDVKEFRKAFLKRGGWAVGSIGKEGKWHTITLTEKGDIIDTTLGQINRPARGIDVNGPFIGTKEELYKERGVIVFKTYDCEDEPALKGEWGTKFIDENPSFKVKLKNELDRVIKMRCGET